MWGFLGHTYTLYRDFLCGVRMWWLCPGFLLRLTVGTINNYIIPIGFKNWDALFEFLSKLFIITTCLCRAMNGLSISPLTSDSIYGPKAAKNLIIFVTTYHSEIWGHWIWKNNLFLLQICRLLSSHDVTKTMEVALGPFPSEIKKNLVTRIFS